MSSHYPLHVGMSIAKFPHLIRIPVTVNPNDIIPNAFTEYLLCIGTGHSGVTVPSGGRQLCSVLYHQLVPSGGKEQE